MSDSQDSPLTTIESLKKLVKEIEEIPDGDVDRYLIIDQIKNIIKDSQKSITSHEIIAARLGFVASIPKDQQMTAIENIKDHALSLGFSSAEFEEFFPELFYKILKVNSELLESLNKEKSNEL